MLNTIITDYGHMDVSLKMDSRQKSVYLGMISAMHTTYR